MAFDRAGGSSSRGVGRQLVSLTVNSTFGGYLVCVDLVLVGELKNTCTSVRYYVT